MTTEILDEIIENSKRSIMKLLSISESESEDEDSEDTGNKNFIEIKTNKQRFLVYVMNDTIGVTDHNFKKYFDELLSFKSFIDDQLNSADQEDQSDDENYIISYITPVIYVRSFDDYYKLRYLIDYKKGAGSANILKLLQNARIIVDSDESTITVNTYQSYYNFLEHSFMETESETTSTRNLEAFIHSISLLQLFQLLII